MTPSPTYHFFRAGPIPKALITVYGVSPHQAEKKAEALASKIKSSLPCCVWPVQDRGWSIEACHYSYEFDVTLNSEDHQETLKGLLA